MSRIQISLPGAAVGQLRVIAKTTGEPTSRVAARFVLSTLAGENQVQPLAVPVAASRETPEAKTDPSSVVVAAVG